MKTIITLFTAVLLSQAISAQTTLIPDANFEQALIDRGYDTGTPDGSVPTGNISGVTVLDVQSKSISDLTGIEDFTALIYLFCHDNQLASLDVSQNTSLVELFCWENQLTSLNVSQNTALTNLFCHDNQLTSLDVSNNIVLDSLFCNNNLLTCLNVKNGNNINMESSFNGWGFWPSFNALNNPSLICIEVDDVAWSTANWTITNGSIDGTPSFSTDCNNPCSSATTGMAEYGLSLNLYPNPVTSSLVVETRYPLQLAIYNVQGKLMVDRAISSTYTMNLSELARGIYFLTATDEQGSVYSQKIIKE